ncbi:reverse transcriptase domain-containing protein [Tanacetum coccineum]
MRTRSQSRRRRQQQTLPVVENFDLEEPIVEQNVVPMADNRTMAQMLQAPIEGYEDAIVVPPINANNFELKQPLINLVQSNKFTAPTKPLLNLSCGGVNGMNRRGTGCEGSQLLLSDMGVSACGDLEGWCSVSKTDFENYVKANDAVLKNVQNQGQNLQNQMANVTSLLTSLCNNFKNSNPGTLPSQTVTNPRQQINAITTRSCKTLDEPSTPLVPIPVVSNPSKEPEQNPETSTEKVQNPNLENAAHVPSPGEEDSIFMEIPKPKAKKTINVEIQDLNSPNPNLNQSRLPYPERMRVRDHDKPSAQYSRFLKMNKEKLEEIAITTVNAECSAIIMNRVPEKLEDPGKFLIPCALQELDRTNALADSGASINLLPHSIYKKLGLEALTPTRMTLELANRSISHPMGIAEDVVVRVDGFTFLADFVVVNFEPDPRVPIILGRPFLRTAKALIDLYEEKLTLRVGKDELVYYADKSEKNKDKNCVHAISIIDFSKDDPFSGSTTNVIPPSSSPEKNNDNIEKFTDELAPLDSLPPGNDNSTLKKEFHEESIPPGIDLNPPPILEVSSSNPTSPTLTGEKVCSWKTPMFFSMVRFVWKMMTRNAIRKKIICILATFLNKKPKPLSRPQEVEEIKEKEEEISSDVPNHTIVMPIRIIFDNPIDFNDHFSKPKDLKKDLTISFDSTTTSILPPPLLDSDSPFTAELSASVILNSLGDEDKVFKPGILVYHAIHDKNLITLEENLKENISSRTLLVSKEPSFLLPPPEPPDECLKNVVLNFYQSQKTIPLHIEDVNSFTFIIWTLLPFFTYTKESPMIFSFRSENFVFDPGIITYHNLVAVSMKVSICSP